MFEVKPVEITRRPQKVTAEVARRPWESRDRVRACAMNVSSSLTARYLRLHRLLWCVVVLYRRKVNWLIENAARC